MLTLLATHVLTSLILVNESLALWALSQKQSLSTAKNTHTTQMNSHILCVLGKKCKRFSFCGLFLFPLSHHIAGSRTMMRQTARKTKLGSALAFHLLRQCELSLDRIVAVFARTPTNSLLLPHKRFGSKLAKQGLKTKRKNSSLFPNLHVLLLAVFISDERHDTELIHGQMTVVSGTFNARRALSLHFHQQIVAPTRLAKHVATRKSVHIFLLTSIKANRAVNFGRQRRQTLQIFRARQLCLLENLLLLGEETLNSVFLTHKEK